VEPDVDLECYGAVLLENVQVAVPDERKLLRHAGVLDIALT